jgi:hypothetical protein
MAALESTVWMIHAGTSKDGVKGRLTFSPDGLVFRPVQANPGAERVFALARIRRAHRVMGSPVLELNLQPAGPGPRAVGFYFVQPPSLEAQSDSGFLGRRRLSSDAAVTLFRWNSVKKAEVSRFVEAIRAAKRGRFDAGGSEQQEGSREG